MNKKLHTAEELALDKKFRKWILNPDPETTSYWEAWLAENPHQLEAVRQARTLLLNLPELRHNYAQEREDLLWQKISEKVKSTPVPTKGKVIPLNSYKQPRPIKKWIGYVWKGSIAASLFIALTLAATQFWFTPENNPPIEQVSWVTKENPYGQKSTIYLSDGTEVMLNSGSKIKYLNKFSKDKRVVELEGEAFFQVAKDTSRPFEVHSSGIITHALGTSFNVKAFPKEHIQVSLVTGKVKVSGHNKGGNTEMLLQPGQSAVYSQADSSLEKRSFDPDRILAWKEGILIFEEADEATVFSDLEKWYGVQIQVKNTSPKKWDYTGEVKKMSLDQFLESLSYTMHFSYKINNKQVIIEYENP